jgi:hypothetical protein
MSKEIELERLLRLPWSILREVTPEGDTILRVKEIPGAIGSGASDAERERDLWDSLAESLRAYLHFGDPVPVPADSPRFLELYPSPAIAPQPMWRVPGDPRTASM